MKTVWIMVLAFSLSACGGGDDAGSGGSAGGSVFKATVGSTDFEETIRCEDFANVGQDLWEFSVYNGKDPGDINVQGLFTKDSKISLTIRETNADGYRAISATIDEVSISDSGLTGSGSADILAKKNSGGSDRETSVPISIDVTCR